MVVYMRAGSAPRAPHVGVPLANFLAGAWAFEVVVFRTCCNVTSRVRRKEEPALPYGFEWSCFGEHFRKTAILPYAVKKVCVRLVM